MTATSQCAAGPGDRVWTEEQRQAIERRGGDLLLDAAAGSGKTSVLVERFVRAVLEDGVSVGEILTITFTEKAAAELRDRIRLRLRELGADDAARATETAFISTIHGFCARVLRTHALAAGLDPRFEVLDRARCDPLAAGAFDDALSGLADNAGPALIELIAAYTVPALRVAILSTHDQLRSAGALTPALPAVGPLPGAEVTATLHAAATALARELSEIDSPAAKVVEALDRVQRALALGDPAAVWPTELGGLLPPRGGASLGTDACEAYREALGRFRAAAAAHAAVGVRDLLDALLGRFSAGYAAAKAAVSGVDFTDLELFTRRLLAQDGELRERYRDRFAAIMVDELQGHQPRPARADRVDRPREPVHGRRRPAVDLRLSPRRRGALPGEGAAAGAHRGPGDAAHELPHPPGGHRRAESGFRGGDGR